MAITDFSPDAIEENKLQRQQQMADMLRQQGMTQEQGRMVGNYYVAPSWTQNLNKVAQTLVGNQMQEGVYTKQKALADAIRQRTGNELAKYTDMMTGAPAQFTLPEDQQGPSQPAQSPDLMGANKFALQSQTPALQQIGLQGVQDQAKLMQAEALRKRYMSVLAQPDMTPQQALTIGVPKDVIESFYTAKNIGVNKVARTVNGVDDQGKPVTYQVDDYGNKVGQPITEWKAPVEVNQGDKRTFVNPVTGESQFSMPVSQSPDSKASNALGWANHTQAGQIAGLNPDGTPTGSVEAMAKLIAEGKMPPISGFALARPQGQAVMARVSQLNPNYDATDFTSKNKAARDFTTGTQGNSMRSFAVAGQHLDQLGTLVDALGNGNINIINKLANTYAAQTGNPAPTNFDAAKDVVSKEVVKAIVASGGGVSERQELSDLMKNANSPAQLKGVIAQYRNLMSAQHDALLQQRRAAGLSDSTLPDYGESKPTTTGVVDFGSLK